MPSFSRVLADSFTSSRASWTSRREMQELFFAVSPASPRVREPFRAWSSRRRRRLAASSSKPLAIHTVQVNTEARARPIITAFTTISAFWYMPQGDRSWARICSPSSSAASGSVGSAFGSAGSAFGSWAAAAGATAPSAAGAAATGAAAALVPASAGATGAAAWLAAGTACAVGSSAKEALGASIRLISRAASRRGGREAILGWALRAFGFMLTGPEGKDAVSSMARQPGPKGWHYCK
ncbi:hypothetical protein D3C85_674910 [compost metagenome]